MGKAKKSLAKSASAAPVNHNKTRECEQRKDDLKKRIELKRLSCSIDRLREQLAGSCNKSAGGCKTDPLFDLRGAAKPARAFYPDPNLASQARPVDYFEQYAGKMFALDLGKEFLQAQMDYAQACVDLLGRSLDAIATLEEMLMHDVEDHLGARSELLALLLERRDARKVNALLKRFPDDTSTRFCFARLLTDFQRAGGGPTGITLLQNAYLANPFLAYALAHASTFASVVDHTDALSDELLDALDVPGSLVEALLYFQDIGKHWAKVEGLLPWLKAQNLDPPPLPSTTTAAELAADKTLWTADDWRTVFVDIFSTALGIVAQEQEFADD